MKSSRQCFAPGRRTAIVESVRTPFVRSSGRFGDLTAVELGRHAVAELVLRSRVRPSEIDELVFGTVVPSISMPNIAREVLLLAGLSRTIPAHSVTRACATSAQAATDSAEKIATGLADVVVAGGAESLSDIPVLFSRAFAKRLVAVSKAKGLGPRVGTFLRGFGLGELAPRVPAIAESSTGLTMGQSAEKMAQQNGIAREAQDRFALRSHRLAARAWQEGVLAEEVAPILAGRTGESWTATDDMIRADSSLEKLASLRPVFDRRNGTITAGSSSGLTDGGAALLLMSEERARAEGRPVLAFLRSWGSAALDPADQLLLGPAWAVPLALDRAGLTLADIDRVEMHEAFAAQVLSTLDALASDRFARERLGRERAVGEIPDEKLNVHGGSIAIGHPFGATGARLLGTLARELVRSKTQFGLVSICAAGGLGVAVVLERAE